MVQFSCLSSNYHIHTPVGKKSGKERYMLSLQERIPEAVLTIFTYMPLASLVKWQSLGARTARKHCLNWLCAGHYFESNISKEEVHKVYEDNQQCLSH